MKRCAFSFAKIAEYYIHYSPMLVPYQKERKNWRNQNVRVRWNMLYSALLIIIIQTTIATVCCDFYLILLFFVYFTHRTAEWCTEQNIETDKRQCLWTRRMDGSLHVLMMISSWCCWRSLLCDAEGHNSIWIKYFGNCASLSLAISLCSAMEFIWFGQIFIIIIVIDAANVTCCM